MNALIKLALSLILMTTLTVGHSEVMLKDVQGKNVPFSTLKGKWVLINYWAGWCQTCVDEIPELNRFHQLNKNAPIALFAVNYDALPVFELKNLIKQYNIAYPSLTQDPASELHLGDITGVPVTFIFNPQGQLVKTLYGGQTAETLSKAVNTAG